jgi:hypothetical protein
MKIQQIQLILMVCITLTGCNRDESKQELKPITIAQLYPGEIQNVDQIGLFDGTTGQSKTISNSQEIKTILNEIKDIKLIPDSNQEGRTGYKFRIKFYEKNNVTLDIIPNHIKEIYYKDNEEFSQKLKQLYKEKFGSEF